MNDKKKLTAKKYLQQLEILDIQINQDIERSSEMRENAIGTNGIDYSRDRVQTSPVGDKLCKDVTNYVAHDSYVDTEIDRFVNAKEQIINGDKDYTREVTVNNKIIKFVQPLYDLQDVGTDDFSIYEMVIEAAFVCGKE